MSHTQTTNGPWSASTWLSVISLAFGTFSLVSSEFLPAGLLTPLAQGIGITEGAAGQTVTATAIMGGIAAPTLALLIGRLDRKLFLLVLCALMIASNLAVAFASNYWVLLGARMLLGVGIGGFWALAGATVVRLVSMQGFGKGMSIIFVGVSAATITAPPLGAVIGETFGWRAAFLAAAAAGIVTLVVQALCLPRIPATASTSLASLFGLFTRKKVRVGLLTTLLVAGGHFAGFTFIRPYLEIGGGLDAGAVAAALLAYGVANFLGNGAGGLAADKILVVGFSLTCLLLGLSTLGLAIVGTSFAPALAFSALWGFAFGAAPVLTQTWMGRAAPDQLEGVGGLFIATFQFSIALGAIAGGLAVDLYGVSLPLLITTICGLLASAIVAMQYGNRTVSPSAAQ